MPPGRTTTETVVSTRVGRAIPLPACRAVLSAILSAVTLAKAEALAEADAL
jgi:hypothetical protein